MGLRDFAQLGKAADFDPLGYEDVAGVIECCSVRGNKLTRQEVAAIEKSKLSHSCWKLAADPGEALELSRRLNAIQDNAPKSQQRN